MKDTLASQRGAARRLSWRLIHAQRGSLPLPLALSTAVATHVLVPGFPVAPPAQVLGMLRDIPAAPALSRQRRSASEAVLQR